MGAINPCYTFVQQVALQFDKQKNLRSRFYPEGASDPTTVGEKADEATTAMQFQNLMQQLITPKPDTGKTTTIKDCAGIISGFFTQTAVEWVYGTGLLKTGQSDTPTMHEMVQESTSALLQKFEQQRDSRVGSIEQLWSYIFQEVYVSGTSDMKHRVLELAHAVDAEAMNFSTWEIRFYRISQVAGNILNNSIVKFAIGALIWWQARKITDFAIKSIQKTYLPQLVNRFINTAPPYAIKVVDQAIGYGEILYANRLKIWLGSLALRYSVGGPVGRAAHWVSELAYLPYTLSKEIANLPWTVAWKLGGLSYRTQGRISQSVATISDERVQMHLDLGGRKAYQMWMNLLPTARGFGIPHYV